MSLRCRKYASELSGYEVALPQGQGQERKFSFGSHVNGVKVPTFYKIDKERQLVDDHRIGVIQPCMMPF